MGKEMSVNVKGKMSPVERQKYLEGKLRKLVSYAYEKSPAIKARFDQAGVAPTEINTIKDLEKLPVLKKDDLVELYRTNPPFGGLVTVPIEDLERVYVSPGPIYDPQHFSQRDAEVTKNIGFGKGDLVINTWAYHLTPGGLMVDTALRGAGATVIPTGIGNTELQVQVMHHLKATGFVGTTGFFMNIITKAEEMGYDIRKDFNLRLAIVGGEMGGGPIRTMIEQKYGIATRDVYGTADAGLLAYECEQKSGMHIAEDVILEIVNPETGKVVNSGEVGEVVVTPIDEIYPLIRFGTGDISSIIIDPCPCGRTSPRLTRILGRVGDAVRARGMFIHPKQLELALSSFPEISRYQLAVTRPKYRDVLTLNAELKGEEGIDREKLMERLSKAVNEAVRVKLDQVEFVAKGTILERGKLIVDERVY